jgi:hypothetical protein
MKNKSNETRLKMGCSMFDASKKIVVDSIINQNPGIPIAKINEMLFLRFYGMDLTVQQKSFYIGNIQKKG